jgi:hypothetical protein
MNCVRIREIKNVGIRTEFRLLHITKKIFTCTMTYRAGGCGVAAVEF